MGRVRSLSFWCLGTAVLWVVVQVFGLTSFYIPTDSMLPELLPGDVIIVNKLSYGARLFNVFIAAEGRQVNIQRLPGMGDVQRNDVVVFNYPCPQKWKKIEMDIMAILRETLALHYQEDVFSIENGHIK